MQVNVAQLLKESTGATRTYDIDGAICADEGQECRVEGKITLTRAARGILAKGSFTCQAPLTCSRCLNHFAHSSAFDVEEMFYPSIDILSGLPVALPDEDAANSFTIDEHHILDMTEMIRQYSLLAAPMKPLCRVDCAGLCPECGANLNEDKCYCARSPRTALAAGLEEAESRRKLG
ncbi:MAG: DUF177 domain-containing protein [Dehalococcoidia bacterium]|nr:DUF177 domain-containing protein [Dehalococcoidia bacterium]